MNQSVSALGDAVRSARKGKNLSQEALAEKAGISTNFLAQVEGTGTTRGISLETLFKLAEALDLSPSKFLEDD